MFFNGYMTVERTGEWSGNFTITIKGDGRDSPLDLYNFNRKVVRVTIEDPHDYDKFKGLVIGTSYRDYCYECKQVTSHNLIAFNKHDNPVYECRACGHFSIDEVNGQDEEL
jgi:hypothetical protein